MIPPQPLHHQLTRETITSVVHRFYQHVLESPQLAGYFSHIDDWPVHEARISDFWWGVMGGKVSSPRPRAMELGHRDLAFGPAELATWLNLFEQTLKESLPENITRQWNELARAIGDRMAESGMMHGDDQAT